MKRHAAILCVTVIASSIAASAQCVNPITDIWNRLKVFHGDLCLGSIMGARIGMAAKDALQKAGGVGKIKATYYTLSCPVDGIQITVGTTYGGRNLEVIEKNVHRLVLKATGNGKQVEAKLTALADDRGGIYRSLSKKAKALPDNSPERKAVEKEMADIVDWFQTECDSKVVDVLIVH